MTYFRALTNLHHTAREARGEDPLVPVGACCDLSHRTEDEQNMLVAMGHVTPISDTEYAEWWATQTDILVDIAANSTPVPESDLPQDTPPEHPAPSATRKRRNSQTL